MRKTPSILSKVILLGMPLALLSSVSMADVIVYGKANVSVQSADENGVDATEVVSNASRLGVKGSDQITSSLKAIYQFEYQTEVDDGVNGSGQTFGQRNIYVGLQGSGGTIIGGHFDTPTKVIQEKVDLFNDLEGDLISVFAGEIRAKNIVQYATPTWGGFTLTLAGVGKETDGQDDGLSVSASYKNDSMFLAVAHDQDVEATDIELTRVVTRFNFGPLQLGLMGEERDNGVDSETGAFASLLWSITDAWDFKTQYGKSSVKLNEGESFSIGVDNKLSASTTVYAYYTTVENEPILLTDLVRDDKYAGIGIDFKF
jgi:predicted porin